MPAYVHFCWYNIYRDKFGVPVLHGRMLIAPKTTSPGIVDLVRCTLHTRLSAIITTKLNIPTCLHLSCHSSPRILTAINRGFGMLCVTGIILGDICRHISRSCKTQSVVTVSDRPNLSGDIADSGWLVKCTSLWGPRVSDLSLMKFHQGSLTSVAWISSASSTEIALDGFRDTSATLFSKFICRIERLWAVAIFDQSCAACR